MLSYKCITEIPFNLRDFIDNDRTVIIRDILVRNSIALGRCVRKCNTAPRANIRLHVNISDDSVTQLWCEQPRRPLMVSGGWGNSSTRTPFGWKRDGGGVEEEGCWRGGAV